MTVTHLSDAELLQKLNADPDLRDRIEFLLLAVEDERGELKEADAAEMRIIDEMRRMGRESLTAWARRQARRGQAFVVSLTMDNRMAMSSGTSPQR